MTAWWMCVAYRLDLEDPGHSAAAIMAVQLSRMRKASRLSDPVLEQRKCLKKLRALLSLTVVPDDAKAWRACIRMLRDKGRQLAQTRDQTALHFTLDKLIADGFVARASLRRLLRARIQRPDSNANIKIDVDAIEKRLRQLDCRDVSVERLIAEASRCYRAARRDRERALLGGASEDFHDWRKRVQRHARQMQLLANLQPNALDQRLKDARSIARMLGEDHDLEAFSAWLTTSPWPASERSNIERLVSSIAERQSKLRQDAYDQGAQLFAERARHFHARLKTYAKQGRPAITGGVAA